jgi:hypothetical protein
MTCPHQTRPPGKDTGRRLCDLGRFKGRPWLGQCNACIKAGANRPLAGDQLEKLFKPIAKALKLPCLDKNGRLNPDSGCGKRRAWLNRQHAKILQPPTKPPTT